MQWNPVPRSALRALVAAAGLALAASAAGAATPDTAVSPAVRAAQIEGWRGRFCTRAICTAVRGSAWGHAVGFGATLILTGWIARRKPPR